MCVWPFVLHVHATGTTESIAPSVGIMVCQNMFAVRAELTPHTHVAAHVISYPCYCCNCCLGILSFKTTCKKCNNANKIGKKRIDEHPCMASRRVATNNIAQVEMCSAATLLSLPNGNGCTESSQEIVRSVTILMTSQERTNGTTCPKTFIF